MKGGHTGIDPFFKIVGWAALGIGAFCLAAAWWTA